MRKTVSWVIAVLMLVLCTVGCASAAEAQEAFDNYVRPRVVTDRPLKVAVLHTRPEVESQQRTMRQVEIEIAHRGWELVDIIWTSDQECRDAMLNAINQDVDAIIMNVTDTLPAKQDLIDMAREKGIGVYSNDNGVIPGIISNSTMPGAIAAMDLVYQIGKDHMWMGNVAVVSVQVIQVHAERTNPAKAVFEAYPAMTVLDDQDPMSGPYATGDVFAFETAKAWFQKYGKELNGVFASCDFLGMPVAEAAMQSSGDSVAEDFWVAGIDGGAAAWDYIRRGTPFRYSYAQPFELYTHSCFEIVDQIQVQGLNPGDEGCLIAQPGETFMAEGIVVTRDNVPEEGVSIHKLFNYYGGDPDDPDAWYNWQDAGGPYTI